MFKVLLSYISGQEATHTKGELNKALSCDVGKAERGNKMETALAEKEAKSVNKSSSCEFNTEDDLKTTAFEIRLGTRMLPRLLPKEI